ncbi:carboxypeptidase-like regulatory domain-containing protein [Kaistella pullorum]|uniref:Carboxypeptidase-like regulatory domain-containing protein n=1 Tax=Kaistella pullorum TaxID=2763074 RepID=A0ABR8WMA8_9FLAO|nr:carboxypeptidase-like regulatory domain-containing protein [Kaistella pullorum]MBD8018185.1 carboxypeptidase-like regulatory domain-containing protein [Kaistella pullorum]
MKNLLNIFTAFVILFSLTSCSEELVSKVQTGTVKGTVIKKGTNQPLKNVKIYTAPSTQTVFTKDDGSFEIAEIPVGEYSLRAELSGYVTTLQGISIKNGGQNVSVVLEMSDDESLNSPPSAPVLLSPTDNAVDQPLSVDLSWSATDPDSLDVLKYTLTVKNDFDQNVIEIKDLTEKHYFLENLKFGVTYYWQVSVSDGVNPAVNSPVFRFKTNSVPNNRFHYVKKSNGNYYIVSSNEAGSNFNFTALSANSWRPRLSQNAQQLAFLRTTGGSTHIFTAKPDGSQAFQVTTIPVGGFNNAELDFSWSTNGKELLYPSFTKLYRINKDGSGLELVYTTPDGSLISECDWSYDGSMIALKTNDPNGYNAKIIVIDMLGNVIKTVLENVNGAAGGLNFSVDGNLLLYTYDISGHQDNNYRQLNTHIFIHNMQTGDVTDVSVASEKPDGTNDLDPRFSPNNAEVIFTNTSNDGISVKNIMKVTLQDITRTALFPDAEMPDWE